MKVLPYEHLKETLYTEQLSNGLRLYILPKEGFSKTYATFTTKYGSIDRHFQVGDGPEHVVPDGIAHFLEHKMFAEPSGDIFAEFSSQGASANAFTSFDRTSYLFSATSHINSNLETLLNFVQRPYFTEENVKKEQGIIDQEIDMYKDNPDWQVYFGLIEALYQEHPVRIDIAGTNESIKKINKDLLYECYKTFYHPSNMCLFVVGGIDPEEIALLVRDNQAKKEFEPQGEIKRHFPDEPAEVNMREKVAHLHVAMPKVMIGFKDTDTDLTGRALLRKECEMRILFDCLFSQSSRIYQTLYDEQLINDQFGNEYNSYPGYGFSVLGGDTNDPDRLIARLKEEISAAKASGIASKTFERNRKKRIGTFLRMLNSPEAIANEFTKYLFKDMDLFEIINIYEEMNFDEVNERLQQHFAWDRMAVSIIRSAANA